MPNTISVLTLLQIVLASSVVATIISLTITVLRDWYARKRSASYSAIRVATTLERFVHDCMIAISDHEVAIAAKGAMGEPGLALPKLPEYPDDVDWKALPLRLCERALTLPNQIELEARGLIEASWKFVGHDDYETALAQTATCGMVAAQLAAELRTECGLSPLGKGGEVPSYFEGHLAELRAKEEKRRAEI
jgi:hypothetical protein